MIAGSCLWLSINIMLVKHSFVSCGCWNELKALWIKGKRCSLSGLKVVANVKSLLSVLPFEAPEFSVGIPVAFRIVSWIRFYGYSWKCKNFWSSSKHSFLFMVQIRLASVKSVKGILFLHCLMWLELTGKNVRVLDT